LGKTVLIKIKLRCRRMEQIGEEGILTNEFFKNFHTYSLFSVASGGRIRKIRPYS